MNARGKLCIPGGSLHGSYVQTMNNKNQSPKEEIRLRVMRLIDEEPKLSQRAIAERLGVSLGSINYCVQALVEKSWVKVGNFRRSDNKIAYAYILTPQGVAARISHTKQFLRSKTEEYRRLKAEIALLKTELAIRDEGGTDSHVSKPE